MIYDKMKYLILLMILVVGCAKDTGQNTGAGGTPGPQGPPGVSAAPTAYTPVALLDPCGTNPSIHNEVFIKMSDGTVLASFSDDAAGDNTRFSVLTPGTYTTTDGDNCTFTIDAQGNITNENHHY